MSPMIVPTCTCSPPEARDTGVGIQCEVCYAPYVVDAAPTPQPPLPRLCCGHPPRRTSFCGRTFVCATCSQGVS